MKVQANAGATMKGVVQCLVVENGQVVKEFAPQNNLILNFGLDMVCKTCVISAAFLNCCAGTGTTPTRDDSGLTTASRAGTTVTLSGGSFVFTNTGTDAGKMIKWDTGEEARVVTVTSPTVVEVATSGTIAAAEFAVFRTNQVGLATEVKRTSTYLTGAANCGSAWTTNTVAMKRTYDFTAEAGSVTYTELGFANSASSGNNLFSRILLSSGVALVAGQSLRVVYTLSVTWTPNTSTAYASDLITGWTGATGVAQIQNAFVSYVDSNGNSVGNVVLEPFNSGFGSAPHISLYTNAITFATMGNQINGVNNPTHTNLVTVAVTLAAYTDMNFYREKSVTYSAAQGNSSSIRSFGLNESNGDNMGFIYVMDNNQTKDNVHTLTLTFRITVGRTLA